MSRRGRFREQSLTAIVLSMARALLSGPSWRPPMRPTAGAPDDQVDQAAVDTRAVAVPPVVLVLALGLVVLAVASLVVLVYVLSSSSSQPALPIPVVSATPVLPGVSGAVATPTPLGPGTIPPGTALKASLRYGASSGSGLLLSPQEAVRARNGLVYVADTGNHRVAVYDRAGHLVHSITRGVNGPLRTPFSMALTPGGHLLVLDADTGEIVEYDAVGSPVRESPPSLGLTHARGIAVDPMGRVLVADPAANAVITLNSDLSLKAQQPGKTSRGDLFEQPSAVAAGANGTIFVMDNQNNRLDRFSSSWQLLNTWPMPSSDTQHSPRVLPLIGGRILVSDPRDNTLLLFDATGGQPRSFALTAVGGASAVVPLGLAADGLPNVLVTFNGSGQVWRVKVPGLP